MPNDEVLIKTVKLDIDIPYDIFMKEFYDIFISKVAFCVDHLGVKIMEWRVKKSQKSGNIHVHMILERPIPPYLYFRLKYCLGEDHKRLVWSWKRYKLTGHVHDFFWNKRIKVKERECNECRKTVH